MFDTLIKKIFGTRNERVLKRIQPAVDKINSLEAEFEALSDDALKAKTDEFKQRLKAGESVDQLLPEAFATVREASKRTLGLRHFDVQLIGGIVLHEGKISEMRTGEGKTLVATLPAYLNALTGKGVHIITVNDYLAKRDSDWMRPIYEFLGLTVGVIVANLNVEERRAAYASDITYGTNNEFGFDYLRDNMTLSVEELVQRDLHYSIVDEVDSILVDEARTPLIISGPAEDSSEMYMRIDKIIPKLKKQEAEGGEPGDFTLDEKQRQAYLTEEGHQNLEEILAEAGLLPEGESLYSARNINLMHHVNAALRAHYLYHKEVEYIVQNNQIVIVDEHTGRTMPGRRWSEGLHQAIEAKEKLKINQENQTLASITFQNFFRLYDKLAGMTGTADTEAYEFQQIYNLEVVVIPTNKPMVRKDMSDEVYINQQVKYKAIIEDIKDCIKRKQPVLVGTASIEASEVLSALLEKEKIVHQVLNAKYHEKEAHIIAQAGKPGAITIATNMAGRGTDIVLGGNLEAAIADLGEEADPSAVEQLKQQWQQDHKTVLDAGGLRIIGSERHESRRIDNQLRGRAGRQGDPGSTRFYLALDDNLMRIFASEKIAGLMRRLGMDDDVAITHPMVNRAIENAQRKVEAFHFDIRKQLLEYDNVANEQRKAIYKQRRELLEHEDLVETIEAVLAATINQTVATHMSEDLMPDEWAVDELIQKLQNDFMLDIDLKAKLEEKKSIEVHEIIEWVQTLALQQFRDKRERIGAEVMQQVEKSIMLQILDTHWREHLQSMDHLRQGIHLRGYAQKDPKQEYKREAFTLFSEMLDSIKYDVATTLMQIELAKESDVEAIEAQQRARMDNENIKYTHQDFKPELPEGPQSAMGDEHDEHHTPFVREAPKVGRNEPCPCGSGKKFKHCHGVTA